MAIEQLIKNAFTKAFNKYLYNELVIGKLAVTETKAIAKKGDEIDVLMPGVVNMFDYDGGDLSDPEEVTTSTAKIRIDRGKAVHFKLLQIEEDYLKKAGEEKQIELVREYTNDAIKQFAAAVDSAYGNLYTRAGHYLDNSGSAIELNANIAKEILAYMQAKFQRGDGKGHTSWVDGEMVCIVPPEYQFYLGKLDDLKYTESGQRKTEKGFIGKLCGWDIMVSNNIANPENGVFYPLFGRRGKTLAGGVSDNLNMQHYIPEKNFDTNYKGYGLYGVGAPRADFLGTVKVSAPLTLTSNS